jgi:phytoene synthase
MAPRSEQHLPALARTARRHDYDRFLVSLLAPPERREALWALIVFNHEIAKTREVVSEATLGQIRLQWWRDAIDEIYDSAPRRHEVIDALAPAVAAHGLDRSHFHTLIDTREWDLQDAAPPSLEELERYCANTNAPLIRLQLQALDIADAAAHRAAEPIGTAYGLTGLLRALPVHARQRRVYLPTKLVEEVAVEMGQLFELKPHEGLRHAVRRLAQRAEDILAAARDDARAVPKGARTPLMLGALADSHLKVLRKADYDVFDPRVGMAHPWRQLALAWRHRRGRF